MKKIILLSVLSLFSIAIYSQTFKSRIITGDEGYLYYQMQQVTGSTHPDATHLIGNITFGLSWSDSYSDLDVLLICSNGDYNIEEESYGKRTDAGNSLFYRKYANYNSSSFAPPESWVNGTWYTIAKFKVTDPSNGSVDISIYTSDGFNFSYDADGNNSVDPDENFTPTLESGQGSVSGYEYPTIIYDYVWVGGGVGGFETNWFFGGNWATECGSSQAIAPTSTNNIYIPDVTSGSGYYPNSNLSGTMSCKNLRIASNAEMSVPSTFGSLTVAEKLFSYGTLTITPNANATITGDTYLGGSECLVVQATSAGVGSFIDNGTITYGASGSAKVQTYLTNSTPWYFHLVGPTVANAFLEDFNVVEGHTYAYEYDVANDTWDNIFNNISIPTGQGIGLSTDDGQPSTINMTGELKTGVISSESMLTAGNSNNLLSNPYPSSVFWDDLYDNNMANINDVVYIYDATFAGGNYRAYNKGTGGTDDFSGYIQVGQGFFVQATSPTTFDFDNDDRYHSNEAFYKSKTFTNRLDVRAIGNDSRDGILIHFYDGTSSGFEPNEDAEKRMSYNPDATQLWSVNSEGIDLSINALPTELLANNYSVPVSFKCSENADYTLDFLGMETFEAGAEIWLEDLVTGEDWTNINYQPVYTFTGSPDDPEQRFIIHFFGPTGVDEGLAENSIDIFSSGQFAYVRNNTGENIKKVNIFTLAGELLIEDRSAALTLNKYRVHDEIGYFVVRVITDKNVYTKKVLITK